MKNKRFGIFHAVIVAAVLLLAGCGHKGDPVYNASEQMDTK